MSIRAAFRVDASGQIGSGHFTRCLALADALRERGGKAYFLCRWLPGPLAGLLAASGHELIQLGSREAKATTAADSNYAEWLGVAQQVDAEQTAAALKGRHCDWLVVDHYALDYLWERTLHAAALRILCVDDLANRQHDCDLLVDQGFYENPMARYSDRVTRRCRTLLGPKFALLRQEFRGMRTRVRPRDGIVHRILVSFGGTDTANATGTALAALETLRLRGVQVDVVIGYEHCQRDEIEAVCKHWGFVLHVQTTQMAELMANADLAIGAGGGSTWERCCLGLPSLTLSIARNQDELVRGAARAGLIYAPSVTPDDSVGLARHVRSLLENPLLITSLSLTSLKLVDGQGTRRVLRAMGIATVHMRPATTADALHLFEWRNDISIREMSRSKELIHWPEHTEWLERVLADRNRVLLVGEVSAEPVGVVRFDVVEHVAEISVYMVPGKNNRGWGAEMILAAERWIGRNRPDINRLEAEVLDGNSAAEGLFKSACYTANSTYFTKRLN